MPVVAKPHDIITADVLEWAASYGGDLFHALLCDPPYHLTSITKRFGKPGSAPAQHGKDGAFARASAGFMGQTWDGGDIAFRAETWAAFLPLLHPGAFGMAFAGSRGWHRLAVAIEDAGFIVHPSIFLWAYASGFPKGTRIDTQIDREAGAEREDLGASPNWRESKRNRETFGSMEVRGDNAGRVTAPATDLAKTWEHHRYGLQAMKPAVEPIILFQKPYNGRPLDNITRTGAGALNIDAGRVRIVGKDDRQAGKRTSTFGTQETISGGDGSGGWTAPEGLGRWPANFALAHHPECFVVGEARVASSDRPGHGEEKSPSHIQIGPDHRHSEVRHGDADGLETVERWACVSECPVRRLNDQVGILASGKGPVVKRKSAGPGIRLGGAGGYSGEWPGGDGVQYGDEGYVSRFFFTAVEAALTEADVVHYEEKADVEERERGLRGVLLCGAAGKPKVRHTVDPLWSETHFIEVKGKEVEVRCRRNLHPTIKPVDLLRWLASLLLPPDAYAPRRLFVPFAGVGSEMIGAKHAGWEEVVGVELHEKYANLAGHRLRAWVGMF